MSGLLPISMIADGAAGSDIIVDTLSGRTLPPSKIGGVFCCAGVKCGAEAAHMTDRIRGHQWAVWLLLAFYVSSAESSIWGAMPSVPLYPVRWNPQRGVAWGTKGPLTTVFAPVHFMDRWLRPEKWPDDF
jgi:hypothetical protein